MSWTRDNSRFWWVEDPPQILAHDDANSKIPHEICKIKIREEDDTHGRVSEEQDAHADDLLRVFEMGKCDGYGRPTRLGAAW